MGFDEIYKIAVWADSVAQEYGVKTSLVTELYMRLIKYHTAQETKNIIEKGFILGEGDRNVCRNVER